MTTPEDIVTILSQMAGSHSAILDEVRRIRRRMACPPVRVVTITKALTALESRSSLTLASWEGVGNLIFASVFSTTTNVIRIIATIDGFDHIFPCTDLVAGGFSKPYFPGVIVMLDTAPFSFAFSPGDSMGTPIGEKFILSVHNDSPITTQVNGYTRILEQVN